MANRSLLAVFVLIAALAAGAILYLTRDAGGAREDAGASVLGPGTELPVRATQEEVADLQTPAELTPDALAAAPRKVERADLVPESKPDQPAVPSTVIWLKGRLVFPPNTPEDERIVVLAHGKSFPGRKKAKGVFEAEVEESGEFRVAFMPKTTRARLSLRARYCYLPSSLRFKIAEAPEELVLEPLLGGRLAGQMTLPEAREGEDPDHRKVLIDVDNWSGGEFLERLSTTDEHGAWEVNSLPPGDGYQVESRSVAFTQLAERDVSIEEGVTLRLDTRATRGVTLRGAVVDSAGQPVEDAEVDADTDGRFRSKEDRTDAEGRFEITGLTPGKIELEARHKSYLAAQLELEDTAEGEVRSGLRLVVEGGGVVEGFVQWPDGSPAVRATVRVDQQQGENWRYRSERDNSFKTGEDGTFRFSGLGAEPCTLQAQARPPKALVESLPGATSRRTRWRVLREDVVPDTGRVTLVLEEAQTLTGRVVDDRGEPVTRFRITLDQKLEGTWTGQHLGKTFSDESGAFEFAGIAPGAWKIDGELLADSARSFRRVWYSNNDERVVHVPQTEDLVLRLERPVRLSGVVLDPSGKPQSGVEVFVSTGGRRSGEAKTGSDGAFELLDIDPGTLVLTAAHDRFARATEVGVEAAPASVHEGLVLALRTGGIIKGEVSPAAGEVAGRRITVMGQSGKGWKQVTSDDDGRFEAAGLLAGTYHVQLEEASSPASSSGLVATVPAHPHNAVIEVVEVADGQTVHVVVGSGPDDPIAIRGRVTAAGEGLAGVQVSAQVTDGEGQSYAGRSDATGAYEVVVDGPGTYRFQLTRGRGARVSVVAEVPAGPVFERDFELPTGRVSGIVRGPAGAAQDVPVVLSWTPEGERGEHRLNVQTGADGSYAFSHLEPGPYTLRAGGMVRTSSPAEFGLAPEARTLELAAAGAAGVDFRLQPGGQIEGSVVDALGTPQSGNQLQVSTDGGANWSYMGYFRSAKVRAAGLASGTVLVRSRRGGEVSSPIEVRVAAGSVATFEITE